MVFTIWITGPPQRENTGKFGLQVPERRRQKDASAGNNRWAVTISPTMQENFEG
jgi:hypothetical protein